MAFAATLPRPRQSFPSSSECQMADSRLLEGSWVNRYRARRCRTKATNLMKVDYYAIEGLDGVTSHVSDCAKTQRHADLDQTASRSISSTRE
jgi:hypothetical protein